MTWAVGRGAMADPPDQPRPASHAGLFAAHRSAVVGAAYRVLGSLADAEDVAQETWLRWADVPLAEVTTPRAYLVRIGTRLALNRVRQLSRQRETYVGPWLPEPFGTLTQVGGGVGETGDPARAVEVAESVSLAMLVVLESLGPAERAAFVLHEVFEVPYAEVADTLDRSETAVRQLVHRARGHVRDRTPRHPVDPTTHARITDRFLTALRSGALDELVALMAPDVVLVSDGGGVKQTALRPIHGSDKILRFVLGILGRYSDPALEFAPCAVNGEPGLAAVAVAPDGSRELDSVAVLTVDDGLVTSILLVRNPAKLAAITLP
ncbi:MAG: RNA polymerase sigma factor SigJ [Propionibacteriaceae bacterium]